MNEQEILGDVRGVSDRQAHGTQVREMFQVVAHGYERNGVRRKVELGDVSLLTVIAAFLHPCHFLRVQVDTQALPPIKMRRTQVHSGKANATYSDPDGGPCRPPPAAMTTNCRVSTR